MDGFIKQWAAQQKEEDARLEKIQVERTAALAKDFYYLINDLARAKFNKSEVDALEFLKTTNDFMIWLEDGYRKSRKLRKN